MAVRGNVSKIIMESKILLPISYKTIWWIILMGIEHERIHLETSSVIMSRLPIQMVNQSSLFPVCQIQSKIKAYNNQLVPVKAGVIELGRNWNTTKNYGWDNEFGVTQSIQVEEFEVS